MFQSLLTKVFGNRNQRLLKKLKRTVDAINAMEEHVKALSDSELTAKTEEFKQRLQNGEALEDITAEAFAVVREASVRVLGLRHFDVQLIAGLVLNEGKIAEMKTGEGKTLMATAPAYLNALTGKAVHVITVNDYLAQRDAKWMGQIYEFLGLTVGVVISGQDAEQKKAAYASDIVYGTNNEYGFDYLRDNMAFSESGRVQRDLGFAVIDEVDSILIDEARTPLIISGAAEGSTELYQRMNLIVPKLVMQEVEDGPGDFAVDEKSKQVNLTEAGHENAERLLNEAGLLAEDASLYDVSNITLMHHLLAGLRAHHLFQKDVDYIVRNDQIVIIDEFTGRMMQGRRWSDGLHQAVEAKEMVSIQKENHTMASITFQNYFRLYDKLSGMTGTADTEAPEFLQIYGLEVVILPTNRPMQRVDNGDLIYRTIDDKFEAIRKEILNCRERNQPVLVGTASIDSSEKLADLLKKSKIPFQILNAKHHEKEAQIIAEAGRPGAVTIATNMAGRGTDIVLGGNLESELVGIDDPKRIEQIEEEWKQRHDQVLEAGGLHVLGTERNESRRIDNQLRGRCGRQGDAGSSRFYLSLEDNLMRIFGSERIAGMMQKLGLEDDEAIEHPWVSKAIENAQKKVEGHNFDMRKQLLEYDDVANEQRKVIYQQRNALMDSEDISDYIAEARHDVVDDVISRYIPPQSLAEQWEVPELENALENELGVRTHIQLWLEEDEELYEAPLRERIQNIVAEHLEAREERIGSQAMRTFEKTIMMKVLDDQWKEHLAQMDYLRQGIGLRGYAQKNPKQEYKRESFEMFTAMFENIKFEVISILTRFHIPSQEEIDKIEEQHRLARQHELANSTSEQSALPEQNAQQQQAEAEKQPFVREGMKIGRNQACPCGSGKKYKNCHGRLA